MRNEQLLSALGAWGGAAAADRAASATAGGAALQQGEVASAPPPFLPALARTAFFLWLVILGVHAGCSGHVGLRQRA